MRLKLTFALATALCAVSGAANAAPLPTVADYSFEDPFVGAFGFTYNPTPPGTLFAGDSGVAGGFSAFTDAGAPDGIQVGFLQSADSIGMISLDVAGLVTGTPYFVSFYAAQRGGYPANPFTVSFNGTQIASVTPGALDFTRYTTAAFSSSVTSGVLTFTGSAAGADIDSVLDDVTFGVSSGAVPEPATWAMALLGFGLIGGATRRRSQAVARVAYA